MLNKFINQGIKNTLIMPASDMEREDKAHSVSPISIAFAVPNAREAVPKATPLDTLSYILNALNTYWLNIFPLTPARAVKATDKDGRPPISLDISIEIAAVVDLGSIEIIMISSRPKSLHSIKIDTRPVKLPTAIPTNMGNHFFLSSLIFLYRGTANTTVAGAIKKLIILPP